MVKLVTLERKTSYGNIRKFSYHIVNEGESDFAGAGFKSIVDACIYDWYCQLRKNKIDNFQLNVNDKKI